MKRALAIALGSVLALSLAAPSGAIVNGQLDGEDHPNVGALIADFRDRGNEIVCSGTLIDSNTFLTAAHCTAFLEAQGLEKAFVSFDTELEEPVVDPPATLHEGTMVTHPDYRDYMGPGGSADPLDIAVVELDDPVVGIDAADLPTSMQFGKARTLHGQTFTAVGYGVHEAVLGGGPPSFPFDGDRWNAVSSFSAINKAWLRLSQNSATGDGGTCFGDSGGPNFLGSGDGETDVVAAVTISGDSMCRATNVTYRLDTTPARDFLDDFVALP